MLTKFAAALLATSLIAGSAIAAQPSGTSTGAAPAIQTHTPSTPAANSAKPGKTVKHTARHRHHVRKHVVRTRGNVVHHARHAKPARTNQAGMAKSPRRT
jgi:hypothetical protein